MGGPFDFFQGQGPETDLSSSPSPRRCGVKFLCSACPDYNQTHVFNWVTLHGNLLRKCHGCGACYRAMLFTLSSHSSGSLFVGLFCKAQPSVQLWEKCGIKVPESSPTLTLISLACHYPFVWMTLMFRLDLWRKKHKQNPGAYATAAVCRRKKSLASLLIEVCTVQKWMYWMKGSTHNVSGSSSCSIYWTKVETHKKTNPSVRVLSSAALRILFAGWRGK